VLETREKIKQTA